VLVASVGGAAMAQFMPSTMAFFVPISMGNQRIQTVADPITDTDALNRRAADASYLRPDVGGIVTGPLQVTTPPVIPNDATNKGYVDTQIDLQRTSPSVVHDIPANVTITGNDQWQQLAIVRMAVQRGGNSRLMVVVSCNVTNFLNIGMVGVRLGPGTPERQAFIYGVTGATNASNGFVVNLTLDISVPVVDIPIELLSISVGGAPIPITIAGGDATVPTRSQITIVDLGPIPAAEETDAESENTDLGPQQQRARPRSYRRRSA